MEFVYLLVASALIVGLCAAAMAIGLIIRNKPPTRCGCARAAERADNGCGSCPDKDEHAG